MLGSGMNLITTIIGFGMSATFIVFVCTRLFCGRLRQFEARQMFEIHSRIDLELVCIHLHSRFSCLALCFLQLNDDCIVYLSLCPALVLSLSKLYLIAVNLLLIKLSFRFQLIL